MTATTVFVSDIVLVVRNFPTLRTLNLFAHVLVTPDKSEVRTSIQYQLVASLGF